MRSTGMPRRGRGPWRWWRRSAPLRSRRWTRWTRSRTWRPARGLWLHVDAAYAGPAAALPRMRTHFRGWERADSIVINPHKWLFTPIDCSVLYLRDPATLRAAFSLTPAFLRTADEGVRHNMDHGLALGRRFRALKLWFVMRYFRARRAARPSRTPCRARAAAGRAGGRRPGVGAPPAVALLAGGAAARAPRRPGRPARRAQPRHHGPGERRRRGLRRPDRDRRGGVAALRDREHPHHGDARAGGLAGAGGGKRRPSRTPER